MRLILRGLSEKDVVMEIDETLPLMMLKAIAEDDLQIPAAEMVLKKEGKELAGEDTPLLELGLQDGDVLHVTTVQMAKVMQGLSKLKPPKSKWRQSAEELVSSMALNPYALSALKQNNPELAEAVEKKDWATMERMLKGMMEQRRRREADMERFRRALDANPFDLEAQKMIEEQIQQENVERARQDALEFMPEAFASVVMLYVKVKVNGVPIKAFVDSGAQMTIMSSKCAERCGLMRLVDRRFQGMAVGVGQQKIIGRVHMAQIEIAGNHLPVSFSVLEDQPMDVLLGLDMLKRHQCIIDLKQGQLIVGTTGNSAPFLSEADIPATQKQEQPEGIYNNLLYIPPDLTFIPLGQVILNNISHVQFNSWLYISHLAT